jgi:hypothetical protein
MSAHPHVNCPFCEKSVADLIEAQLETGPKSAADITKWLRDTGHMPAMWTWIDVADYLAEWYGSGDPLGEEIDDAEMAEQLGESPSSLGGSND